MYSKKEASLLTQQFWTNFGGYISPVLSAEGERINWINYKTGEKDVRFLLKADKRAASVSIVLLHKDRERREKYFYKFLSLREILEQETGETWQWLAETTDAHGKAISLIINSLEGVNVFNRDDWPAIISFFKPLMISLDKFWCEYKYAFEQLRS